MKSRNCWPMRLQAIDSGGERSGCHECLPDRVPANALKPDHQMRWHDPTTGRAVVGLAASPKAILDHGAIPASTGRTPHPLALLETLHASAKCFHAICSRTRATSRSSSPGAMPSSVAQKSTMPASDVIPCCWQTRAM